FAERVRERGTPLRVELVAAELVARFVARRLRPGALVVGKDREGRAVSQREQVLPRRGLVARTAVHPVFRRVHEVAVPEEREPHLLRVEREVSLLRIAHRDRARPGPLEEIAVGDRLWLQLLGEGGVRRGGGRPRDRQTT